MSDFFMIENNDYWNKKVDETKKEQNKQANQNTGVFNQRIEEYKKLQQERYENIDRYGVEIPDEYYEIFNQIIGKAESPEVAQEEAYRLGSAIKYSQLMNEPFLDVYKNVDAYNEANFPDLTDQKTRFEAISDMFSMGINNVQLGKLGQKLMKAIRENDTELTNALMAEIDAINQNNVLLQDNTPRRWIMQALEAGAQSLPFTGYVAGAGTIGNFIHPAVGTGAAFVASSYLSAGQEYLDLLANGADPQTAEIVATVSGGIQGIIEANLGITNGIVKGTAKTLGKDVARNAAEKSLEEIGRKVFKRFHFGAGKKLLLNYLKQYGKNILGEGAEEFLQEITSIAGQEIAASLDGYDIPDDDFKSIVKQTTEAFRGGVLGALSMGFIPAGINGAADIKSFKNVKEIAETYESGEMFKEAVKDNPVFEGMKDDQKNKVIQEVWERAQQRKEEKATQNVKEIAEGLDAGEGAEERKTTIVKNENGEEEEIELEREPTKRDEKTGKLIISDDEEVQDDGTVKGNFVAGDETKKENNRYGYISYTADENNRTVTIDSFKMAPGREGLRSELFEEFAQKYAGYNIEWNTIGSETASFKEELIKKNPSGAKNGLNYYNENDIDDIGTRKRVAEEVRKNIYSIEQNADGSFTRTQLSNEKVAAAVALMEAGAKRMGMSLTDYVSKTFGNQIFGDKKEFEKIAVAQGDTISGKAGGALPGTAQKGWKEYGQQVKAVIYAGENADFSTWTHELAHIFQNQLDGDLKAQAEKAFNVIDGDWINSKYTFADGHVDSAAEAFAYGFQDWLKTGKAQSEEMKNIFQKFAEFIVRAYNALKNHINLTPEIENIYNQLLQGDDSLLAKAQKAVEEQDKNYKAELKRQAEEKENAAKAQAQAEEKARAAEREEQAEYTDFTEEKEELTPEMAEEKLNEVANENTEKETNAIDDALENTNLTEEQKEETAQILKDENSTVIEKAEAVTDAASSAYIPDDLFFQKIVSDDELKEIISEIKHTETRQQYIDEHYTNKKSDYEINKYTSEDGKITANLEVYKYRNPEQKEIDEALFFANKGIDVTILDEPGNVYKQKYPDVLFNHSVLVEFKQVVSDKVNTIAGEIRDAANKGNSEVISVFFEDKSKNVNYEDVIKKVEFKQKVGDFTGEYDELLFVKDGEVTRLNKNAASPAKADTHRTSNNTAINSSLSNILFQTVYHGSPYIIHRPGGDVIRDEELGFDHSKMGTGEGVQAFGWGTYVTQVEGIANNYAKKLSKMPYTENEAKRLAKIDEIYSAPSHLLISIESKKDFLKARRASLRSLDNGGYETRINKNIKNFTKELKTAKREKDEENIKFYEDLIDTSIKDLEPERKESLRKTFQEDIDKTLVEIEELKKQHKVASKLLEKELPNLQKELEEIRTNAKNRPAENVYTLDIPDEDKGNYIAWDEPISIKQYRAIYEQAKKEKLENFVGYLIEDVVMNDNTFTPPTGEWLYKQDLKYDNLTNKEKSLFLNRAGITGISYPAQFLSGGREDNAKNFVIFNEKDIKVTDWHARNIEGDVLFQRAYHGSGANFDKFDTENFGLSGEGSMSFGYGTYVTDSEEIARDYAERQADNHAQLIRNAIIDVKSKLSGELSERAKYTYEKELEDLEEKLRIAESSKPAVKIALEVLKANNFDAEKAKKDFENDPDPIYRLVYEYLNKYSYKELEAMTGRNLYTVEIPDDGYLNWKENISKDEIKKIVSQLKDFYDSIGFEYRPEQLEQVLNVDDWYSYDGKAVYETLEVISKGQRKIASQFLHSIGYAGIKYPAGTIHGNGNGAYNYVIFNDEDAKIVDHLFFQTEAELMEEAKTFDSWEDFQEYCEAVHAGIDEVSPIPNTADAQWYQSFWETSHGLQTEAEKNEQAVNEKIAREDSTPVALDAYFATKMRSDPTILDDFLKMVAYIDSIDFESEEWRNVENKEEAAERERLDQLKDFIDITLSDYNWQTALKRVRGGNEISERTRKNLLGEITDSFKTRDFRALYAEVMEDPQYAVDEEDTISEQLKKKLSKYKKYDIALPNEDISRLSPEKRKRLAEQIQNAEIANKIRNGTLKLDDELDNYIKSINKQVAEKQKQFDELEKETKADYQRVADAEQRTLLKLHDELLLAKGSITKRSAETERMIDKGLKITGKYKKLSQNLKADYDEIFRKFNDLKDTIRITAEVQAALDRQDQLTGIKEDLNQKNREKNALNEIKKMRIQLVKRAMRRVPFNRIDYTNARTVIAIQRMLEPNLMGGVNRFIGIDSPFLRGVISGIVTDSEYKQKILNYLKKHDSKSQTFVDFVKKIENLNSIKDFDSWTKKEREYAIKHLPKENWVKDLNLEQLAKEREESIDLDIDLIPKKNPAINPKTGEIMTDKEGNVVYETQFTVGFTPEIGKLVRDAVGADMFDMIINQPFAEWTTEDLERLAKRIDELYTEGREMFAAKQEARKREYNELRNRVENVIKETGITLNDDDTPEEKQKKLEKINKILGLNSGLKGTEAGKNKGFKAKLDRLIHGYNDANILRVARILDNYSEGENVRLLYRMEDDCFNSKQTSIMHRGETINRIMKDNKISEADLAKTVKSDALKTEFTVDELLFFLAADEDNETDVSKMGESMDPLDANDDYAATSRNAVMFGNMMSDTASQELKEQWLNLDKEMEDAIANDTLTVEQRQLLATGQLDKKPGTTAYIAECHRRWTAAIALANSFITEHPEYKALMEAIQADYASQYERMNEISINEFNMPVHRVKAYVPLVRRESNGDTNVNQVREDLIGAYGGEAGKQWVNKGMTQRRVNISPLNQKPVQTGLFRTWGDSVERTEHFIAYAPYVRMLNAVYKSRDAAYTRRFMEARYGKGMLEYIDNYINEVANPNANKIREKGAELLHTLRGKTAPAYLGWKFSAIIKQGLTSPWPYMQFVNPAEYTAALFKCINGGFDAVKEKSAFMASRVMDPINELVDEMADQAKTKFDRGMNKFSKMGMQGLEWIDWVCVAPGWLACYQKEYSRLQKKSEAMYRQKLEELTEKNMYADIGTSEYMSKEKIEAEAHKAADIDIELEAVRYADDCTRQCQPSSRAADLSPLFKNSSEAMKAFLQFQTSLNVIWQNIRYDIPYAVRNKQYGRIVGAVLGYTMAGIFMNSVMEGLRGGDDDDDDTQVLRNLLYYSTTQFTDAIPMFGSEITNTMDQLITGKRGFYGSGTDMTPSATKLLSALQKAQSGNWEKAAALTAEGIGLFMGAPVSGIKEINKLLGKPLDEGDVNLLRGISDVYGLAGDIIGE